MNIPTRVLKSTFITYDTYIQHQQLAKRFYKSNKALKKSNKAGDQNETGKNLSENEHVSLAIGEFKHSFKEDLMKWFFSLNLQEKIKAVAIENKWFSTMVLHMYSKYKYDQKIRFQLKLDDVPPEEYCYQQYFGANQNTYSTEMNLDNFFYYKNDRYIPEDRGINEILFLKELRYFSLREQNDTLTLSTNLLENEPLFKYFIDHFSNGKAFMHYCTVSFDNVFKVYNWDFPEWFNPREYNSISEFIIAYIEQVLSIRFWYSLEEKKEKMAKNVPIPNFSLYEEPNFTEIFENRDKLNKFLVSEYKENKEKLFDEAIDLKKILQGLKNDETIIKKIKKPKPESIKNYFYLINKTKFELFEPPIDNDHEIIDKLKKNYFDNSEEVFIDELIFSQLENLKDFMYKKLFEVLHNIYTEKNANELMNEEFLTSKKGIDQASKSKRGRIKKNANKKKKNNTAEDRSSSPNKHKEDKHDSFEHKSEEKTSNSSSDKEKKEIVATSSSLIRANSEGNVSETKPGITEKSEINTLNTINKLSDPSEEFKLTPENKNYNIHELTNPTNRIGVNKELNFNYNLNLKKESTVNAVTNTTKNTKTFRNIKNYKSKQNMNNNFKYVTLNDDNEGKMSWRKGSNLSNPTNIVKNTSSSAGLTTSTFTNNANDAAVINSNYNLSKCVESGNAEDAKQAENKEEAFVNNFVKNLLSQIVTNDSAGKKSNLDNKQGDTKPIERECSCSNDVNIINDFSSTNVKDNSNSDFIKGSKLITEINPTAIAGINSYFQKSTKENVNKIKKQNKIFNKNDFILNDGNEKLNLTANRDSTTQKKKTSKTMISPINKEYIQNYEVEKKEEKFEASSSLIHNSKSSKFYTSDNECKIETINHEIIQNTNSISGNMSGRVMVDNFSQTDSKKEKSSQSEIFNESSNFTNLTLSETIQSSTHDEEEKPRELDFDTEDKKNENSLVKNKKKTKFPTQTIKDTDKIANNQTTNFTSKISADDKPKLAEVTKPNVITNPLNKPKNDILGLRKGVSEGNKPLSSMSHTPNPKPTFAPTNTKKENISDVSNTMSNTQKGPNVGYPYKKNNFQNRYHNTHNININTENDDEFNVENEDENMNSYAYKKYNKGYYSNFYNKRNRYPYTFGNCNKFNNPDNGYLHPGTKDINSRPFYTRNFMDFSSHINNFGSFTPIVSNVSMYNYSNHAAGLIPEENPSVIKESSIYNNYYIINSNVNINNIHNNGVLDGTPNGCKNLNDNNRINADPSSNNGSINISEETKSDKLNSESDNGTNNSNISINSNSNSNSNLICNNYINVNMADVNKKNIISPIKTGMYAPITPYNTMSPLNQYNQYPVFYNGKREAKDESPSGNNSNILNRIGNDIYPFIFHYRLHNDILEYSSKVTQAINYLKDIKLYIINFLKKKIEDSLQETIMMDLYGSFATDLSIESSDIDITIKFEDEKSDTEIKDNIEKLCISFNNLKLFETITPITSASVPVIKILIDPSKILEADSEEMKMYNNLKNIEIYENYKFDVEELLKVKVDLTFIQLNQSSKNYNKYQSTKNSLEWARKALNIHPEIKPIIHVLKRYLQIKKLNSSFNGGLSSFSLFLIIIAYLKYPKVKTRINLGRIFMEMLEVYGKFFNYAQTIIDVNLFNPFVIANEILDNIPVILDPVTGLNVAKNSFRIEEVRESFAAAYDIFNNYKLLFDKKDLPNSTNVVYDLLLNCNRDMKFK